MISNNPKMRETYNVAKGLASQMYANVDFRSVSGTQGTYLEGSSMLWQQNINRLIANIDSNINQLQIKELINEIDSTIDNLRSDISRSEQYLQYPDSKDVTKAYIGEQNERIRLLKIAKDELICRQPDLNYERLTKENASAFSERQFKDLAEQFYKMNGYKDSIELARECEVQYRTLKNRREEQERIDCERREAQDRKDQAERERREADERIRNRIAAEASASTKQKLMIIGGLFGILLGICTISGIGALFMTPMGGVGTFFAFILLGSLSLFTISAAFNGHIVGTIIISIITGFVSLLFVAMYEHAFSEGALGYLMLSSFGIPVSAIVFSIVMKVWESKGF